MSYAQLSEDAVKLGVKELNRYKRDAKRFGQPAVVSCVNIALDCIAVLQMDKDRMDKIQDLKIFNCEDAREYVDGM